MVTQYEIVGEVIDSLPSHCSDDLPAIRQAINDTMDMRERNGQLSRSRSDTWSQSRMVKKVQQGLKDK